MAEQMDEIEMSDEDTANVAAKEAARKASRIQVNEAVNIMSDNVRNVLAMDRRLDSIDSSSTPRGSQSDEPADHTRIEMVPEPPPTRPPIHQALWKKILVTNKPKCRFSIFDKLIFFILRWLLVF